MDTSQTVVEGVLEHLIFRDRSDGWSPGRLRLREPLVSDGDSFSLDGTMMKAISVVGRWPSVTPGMPVRLTGAWKEHAQYGAQFAFDEVEVLEVTAPADIEVFLAHRLPKVGKVRAKRIVEKYGEDAARILDENPEVLAEIPSISLKMALEIKQAWIEYREEYGLAKQLERFALPPQWRASAIRQWQTKAPEVLDQNVFLLVDEVSAPFDVAEIARRAIGMADDDPRRVRAAIKHLLAIEVESRGHTRVEYTAFLNLASAFLHLHPSDVDKALVGGGVAVVEAMQGMRWIYRNETWEAERAIAEFILGVFPPTQPDRAPAPFQFDLEDDGGWVAGDSPRVEVASSVDEEEPADDGAYNPFVMREPAYSADGTYGGPHRVCDKCGQAWASYDSTLAMPCCKRMACRACFERAGSVRIEKQGGLSAPCPFCPARLAIGVESGHPTHVVS